MLYECFSCIACMCTRIDEAYTAYSRWTMYMLWHLYFHYDAITSVKSELGLVVTYCFMIAGIASRGGAQANS